VGPILTFWDRFAIGVMISSAAVALYVIPFNLVSQLAVVPAALATALFPKLAAANPDEARAMGDESLQVLAFVLAPATLLSIIAAGLLLPLWLGAQTASAAAPVAYILLFGFWANGLARLPAARLQAERRPHLLAFAHLAELIPYVALLYVALRVAGINGAAMAWSARVTADAAILFFLAGISRAAVTALIGQGTMLAVAVAAALAFPLDSPTRWLIHLGLFALMTVLAFRNPPLKVVEQVKLSKRWLSHFRSRQLRR
jgi:O-antigen/teichoic acid export membrane protein